MKHTEIKIDNESKSIYFSEQEIYPIGVCLLSFIELDLTVDYGSHPYIRHFSGNKKTLADLQAQYKEAVIECLYLQHYQLETPQTLSEGMSRKNYIPPVKRMYHPESSDSIPENKLSIHYKAVEMPDGKNRLLEVFTVNDISSVCYLEFMKMVQFGINVRKCFNCRTFFISKGDYDTKYCDRVPQGESRTCQQIGAVKVYQAKVAENPLLAEYGKLYRRFHSRKRNGMITSEQFKSWSAQSAKIRDKAVSENIPLENFRAEIDSILI